MSLHADTSSRAGPPDAPARCKAEHYSLSPVTRGRCSAVAKIAYVTRARIRDARTGQRHDYRRRSGDLVHVETVGFAGTPGAFANMLEKGETRRNARTAREIVIALPRDLTPKARLGLARGHALWLRKRYGVACLLALHEPHARAAAEEGQVERGNPHVHIIMSTRSFDRATGMLGAKTRVLDDLKAGPGEILALRMLWAHRATRALQREGRHQRVDLRSIRDRVRTGDLPEGTLPQTHLGPVRAERARQREARGKTHLAESHVARNRRIAANNERILGQWLALRALYRRRQRERNRAREIAAIEAARQGWIRLEAEMRETARQRQAAEEAQAEQDRRAAADAYPEGWQGGTYERAMSGPWVCEPYDPATWSDDLVVRPAPPGPGAPVPAAIGADPAEADPDQERRGDLSGAARSMDEIRADPRHADLTDAERNRLPFFRVAMPDEDPIEVVLRARGRAGTDPAYDLEDPDLDLVAAGWIDPQPKLPPRKPRRAPPDRQRVRQLGD